MPLLVTRVETVVEFLKHFFDCFKAIFGEINGKGPAAEHAIAISQKKIVVIDDEDRQRYGIAIGGGGWWECIFHRIITVDQRVKLRIGWALILANFHSKAKRR